MAPPPPPPPPMGNFKLGGPALGKPASNATDSRSALLQSIQMGTKLKKTTTVDKSGPLLSGRITNSNSNNNNNNNNSSNSTNSNAPSRPPQPTSISAQSGGPKLGGIFEGMASMPKLKPVGARNTTKSPPSESPSSTSSIGSPQNTNANLSTGSMVDDLNAELTKHLTLKKQKKQQQQESSSVSDSASRVNRGPPPQPPNKNLPSTITDNKISNSTTPVMPPNGTNASLVPNKSSLFGRSDSTNGSNLDVNSSKTSNKILSSTMTSNSTSVTVTNKVVPNHGKPNCAPKPPGIQQLIAAKRSISPNNSTSITTNNESSTRPVVSRHHSMRSPRSPPITAAGPTFPTTQQFCTIRGTPMAFKSQDAIHVASRQAPQRPTVAPPRPPVETKNHPSPPPPPIRSVSNTNLSTLTLSVPPGKSQNSSTTSFGGSAGNVSSLTAQATNSENSDSVAPPLPPHRTCPPPPPSRGASMTPASNNNGAPPVPQRHSSMRNSNPLAQTTASASSTTTKSTRTVNRNTIDLDAKFGHAFHNVTEFPAPQPFQNLKNGVSVGN